MNPSAVGLQAVLRALEADCHLRVTEWSLRTHLSQVLRAVSLNSVGTAVQCLHLLVQGNMHLSYAKLALQDLEQPGSVTNRTWTISSHPSTATGNTPQFSITVKCIGLVSKWLHSKLKPGEACLHGWLPAAGKTAHVQSLVLLRLDYADPDCQSCHCASAQMSSAAGLHRAATWLLLPGSLCCNAARPPPASAAVLHRGNMHTEALNVANLQSARYSDELLTCHIGRYGHHLQGRRGGLYPTRQPRSGAAAGRRHR